MDGIFNTTTLPPRTLGSLTTNSTCRLFGWGGSEDNPETVEVEVFGPQYCNLNLPQAYCTDLLTPGRACQAYTGSPVVCSAQTVDGFLLQTGCPEASPGRYLVDYHSVAEFREWIDIVSSADLRSKISIIFLLSVVVISFKNLL